MVDLLSVRGVLSLIGEKQGGEAELFLKNPKKYFEGFLSGVSRMAGFGEGTPQQDSRRGKNEQKVNFGTSVESCSKKLPDCRSLPTATFSGFTPYYWAFGNLPNRQQKSSKSVSDLLLHVPLRGGGYSVVNNKRGR